MCIIWHVVPVGLALVCSCARVGFNALPTDGSGDSTLVGGDIRGGNSQGDAAGGDAAGDDATGDNSAGGDAARGDAARGDTARGDAAGDNAAAGDSQTSGQCPAGYATIGGSDSCYRSSTVTDRWLNAEADCEATTGAHLIVIDDAIEQALFTDEIWIGLSERATSGTFLWVTGAPLTFDRWALPEPQPGPPDPCVVSLSDGWHDFVCNLNYLYVCEHDGNPADPAAY